LTRTRRSRDARISTGLIVILGLVLLIAGGFWWSRLTAESGPKFTEVEDPEYPMVCAGCGEKFVIKKSQQKTWEVSDDGFKCPKCGKLRGQSNREGGMALTVPRSDP
jgi:DNA-directed RNA polymerase subunit RPC12/RpoP